MADPFSLAVSVLTVTEAAASSCGFIYKTLRSFSDAPEEIEHQIATIQALQSTFAGIAALEVTASDAVLVRSHFKAQLEACTCELQSMEKIVKSFQANVEKGRARRTWAKMRWASPDHRDTLKRYLKRIENYYRLFSLDLSLLNTQLALRPTNVDVSAPNPPCYSPQTLDLSTQGISNQAPQLSNLEPLISLRSSICRYLEYDFLRLLLWLGPVIKHQRQDSESEALDVSLSNHGYGITLAAASRFLSRPMRVEFGMSLLTSWNGPTVNLSVNWSLSCPRMLSRDDDTFNTALIGDVDAMKYRFSMRFSTPNDTLPDGWSLLHIAASQGHVQMIKLLLQEGARVNAASDYGLTPLHGSIALSKNYDASRILIENGADLYNRDSGGKTPLHTFTSPVLEQVLQSNESTLDFSARDNSGRTFLHYLAWSSKTSTPTFQKYHKRSALDSRSTTIPTDTKGLNPLHLAAQRGNVPIVEYILSTSAHPSSLLNSRDASGETPLHHAIESRKRAPSIITALISAGADAGVKNNQGWTPLRYASLMQNWGAVQAFEELGFKVADCYVPPPFGYSIYDSTFSTEKRDEVPIPDAASAKGQRTLPSPPPQHSHYNVPFPKNNPGSYIHHPPLSPPSYVAPPSMLRSVVPAHWTLVVALTVMAGVYICWALFPFQRWQQKIYD